MGEHDNLKRKAGEWGTCPKMCLETDFFFCVSVSTKQKLTLFYKQCYSNHNNRLISNIVRGVSYQLKGCNLTTVRVSVQNRPNAASSAASFIAGSGTSSDSQSKSDLFKNVSIL